MCSSNLGSGWNISQQGWGVISENNVITDTNALLKNALNADLKEIGSPVLNKESNKNQISELVLQIQKIRNVAAPKANEESNAAPRMLKLTLTDGESFVQAIETATIPSISREKTPPGSKVLLKNVKIMNGFLCLNQNNTKLLGGKVPHMFEKWELAKSVQHHNRNTGSADGPPAWVNFGIKISNLGDGPKVLDNVKTKDQIKENTEFENLRKDAIAEVATGAVKKVFGAGAKIVQTAPRIDTNRGRNEGGKQSYKNKKEPKSPKETIPQKPSDKVSLFDFLENKLQKAEGSGTAKSKPEEMNGKFANKYDIEDKKNSYNDASYHKNFPPNKDYGNIDKKSSSEPHFYSQYDNLGNNHIQKQSSFRRDIDTNRKEYKNRDFHNIDNTKPPKGHESNNFSNRYNSKEYPNKKNPTSKHYNDSQSSTNSHVPLENQSNKKHFSDDSNTQKFNKIGKRNEEERVNDNWHYRAPNLTNQEEIKSSNNVDILAENVVKMSLGGEFASRSLRQHLNLQTKKPNTSKNNVENNRSNENSGFGVGSECLAKYWEDNKFYPAKITAYTETTYVVQFKGYGNIEEVLKSDCTPLEHERGEKKRNHKGSLEFRRNPKKFEYS